MAASGATAPSASGLGRSHSLTLDSALASEIFDHFCRASTLKAILRSHRYLCEVLRVKPGQLPVFYPRLRAQLRSWKAQALWAKFDKRAAHKVYKQGQACAGQRVLVIGAGPCGLRAAIEAQLLGAKVVVVEKRDRFSRNNVLHLWPFNIHDLRGLGAKKFYGKFCAGAIDHISIRQLQCILLKVSLLLGVEVFENVSFEGLEEPSEDGASGWRARYSPADHPVAQYEMDVVIGADGKRNTLPGFKRKEFRGKLAIAITANFINRHSDAESHVEEISGVAFIFNQKFFNDLNEAKGISLENIVYYKDETHYFVMTAKKQSLLNKGVILKNEPDTAKLLAPENICQEALFEYAREAADFATDYQMPQLDFAVNHYGKPDVAMFDFTSMFQADNSSRIIERHGHRLLTALVGDSLLEPFWPTGTGCARGFFGGLDACWLMRSLALGKHTMLECLAERESIYRILAQTTPENTCKDYASYTVDPQTRYPTLNRKLVLPFQIVQLVDTDNPALLEEELALSTSHTHNKHLDSTPNSATKKKRRRESHVSADTLLAWFQKQLSSYDCLAVSDMTYSFQDGLALCAILHRYRPELVDFQALDPQARQENCQLAFDILEQDLGVNPVMTGRELAGAKCPDKLLMLTYLSQVYEVFRKDIPAYKLAKKGEGASDDDLLEDSQYRYNHAHAKQRRRLQQQREQQQQGPSIGQLVASDALGRKKKRRSKEPSSRDELEEDEPAGAGAGADTNESVENLAGDKENIQQTMKMNRSAHKKRLQRLAEASANQSKSRRELANQERRSIKKEDRFKAIEEQFAGSSKKRESLSKYRENKKPKELKRAIGKLDKDDWNIKNIENKLIKKDPGGGAVTAPGKVPKWSKAAFQDKFNLMKDKLETGEEAAAADPADPAKRYSDIDTSLARLQRKLREGNVLETGQRGSNKVSALAGELFPPPSTAKAEYEQELAAEAAEAAAAQPAEKREFVMPNPKCGSETCHFCTKRVYVVERMSAEGKFFHRSCFRCDYCNILLRLGSYAYQRDGPFGGKFFCIPHYTVNVLEKYRYRHKADERQDAANRQRDLLRHATNHEWDKDRRKSSTATAAAALSPLQKDRLLADQRGATPERIEFEVSVDLSEEDAPSIMDEDEWTDRNFGSESKAKAKAKAKSKAAKTKADDDDDCRDTSDDSVSDLDTDDDEDEDDDEDDAGADDGPASRPLTADEARQLQKEWIKRYDPGSQSDEEEEDEDTARRKRPSYSSSSSTDDDDDDDITSSSDYSSSDDDYDGEYESDTTSDEADADDSDMEAVEQLRRQRRLMHPLPPETRPPQRRIRNDDDEDEDEDDDSSTEVGSEDLSSAEEDDDEDDELVRSAADRECDFSSGSATECEFTDSEGRPNPFHKQLDEPQTRPRSQKKSRSTRAVRGIPTGAAQIVPLDSQPQKPAPTSMTYASQYQYKTPNLSDRLKTEQQKTTSVVQDFSTRRALNLKKNWVSEASASVAAKPKVASSEIDNRLKSLMDRLSNQQKLLKPAEKPSTEMQHFLTSTTASAQQQNRSSIQAAVRSPPLSSSTVTATAQTEGPPAYKSPPFPPVSNIEKEQSVVVAAPPSSASIEESPKLLASSPPKEAFASNAANSPGTDSSSKDEQRNVDTNATVKSDKNESGLGGPNSSKDEFESCNEEPEDDVNEAVNPGVSNSESVVLLDATVSETSTDQNYATPASLNLTASQSHLEPEEEEEKEQEASAQPKAPPAPAGPPPPLQSPDLVRQPPLATSSPMDPFNIGFIDDESPSKSQSVSAAPAPATAPAPAANNEDDEELPPPRPPSPPPPPPAPPPEKAASPPVFNECEVTGIYRQRNPRDRIGLMNSYREKEKSVVHDLILSRVASRSSSGVRRSPRTMPSTTLPMPPPTPAGEEQARTPKMARQSVKKTAVAPKPATTSQSKIEQMSFPLIDDESAKHSRQSGSSAESTPRKKPSVAPPVSPSRLPPTPLTDPERFGFPSPAKPPSRASRPVARYGQTNRNCDANSGAKGTNPPTSPAHSSTSNDMDYMDGALSTDESPSKSTSSSGGAKSSNGGEKKTFLKTISGIFSRSSSLSSISRQRSSSASMSAASNHANANAAEPSSPPPSNHSHANSTATKELNKNSQNNNFKFPKLAFRSTSVSRDNLKSAVSPTSPQAPKASLSELGSLPSLSSASIAATPKKEAGSSANSATTFKPQLNLHATHPSTPPVPLSRKITMHADAMAVMAAAAAAGAGGDSLSENEENESPDSSFNSNKNDQQQQQQRLSTKNLPPEILEKLLRRGGSKSAKRQARVAQLKRVRKAQELQRQLEELDVQHRDLEERGVRAERKLRGESDSSSAGSSGQSEAELMQGWFGLLAEKNALVRREQELLVQAKQLELEDQSARLEQELREHLMLDSRSPESVVREGEVLKELLEISEQREKLQDMLERDKQRYQREDLDIEAHMRAKGISLAAAAVSANANSAQECQG